MALLPNRYQSLTEPFYGQRMMYDGAPIMDGGYGLLDGGMMASAAAQPMTQEAAPSNQNIQYITAPVSNKGNPTSKTSGNVFAVATDQPVRLVDLRTNKVVFEGTGVEAARKATELGQNLTDTLGRKANYDIQTADPSGAYKTVANEKANKSVLGQIADVALPIAAGFIPGVGPVLGAALGSAASSAAQGRSLENTLLRAGLAAGGSALGGQLFGKAVPGGSAPMSGINADLIPNALEGLSFGSLTGAAIPAGVGGAAGDILVTAATRAAPSLTGATLGSVASSALPSLISSPPSTPTEQAQTPEEIEAQRNPIVVKAPTNLLPADFITSAAAAAAANAANGMADAPDRAEMTDEELNTYMNAVGKGGGVLGTGLNLPQLVSIGGIGADLLKNLLAGGGDTGAGTPYVSPFGTGVGFAPGQDMRANPNITDYERYGFGPEAMFFRPEYSGLLSSAAPAPQAQPAMAINPVYQPLI